MLRVSSPTPCRPGICARSTPARRSPAWKSTCSRALRFRWKSRKSRHHLCDFDQPAEDEGAPSELLFALRVGKVEGTDDDRSKCVTFPETEVRDGSGLGAFQSFPFVRPGQQIYFARDIAQRTDSPLTAIWQRAFGNTFSPEGALLVIDVAPPLAAKGPLSAKLKKIVRFNIDDRFDPMMPITRKVDDLRFLSLEASKSSVHLRTIDFAGDNPSVGNVRLTMGNGDVELDRSWAERPMLVLETRTHDPDQAGVLAWGNRDRTGQAHSDHGSVEAGDHGFRTRCCGALEYAVR